MGYKRMTIDDLYSIFRRWHTGQSIKHISEVESKDRKTIRLYISKFTALKFSQESTLPDKSAIMMKLQKLIPHTDKPADITNAIAKHKEEILDLIHHPTEPVKPKTAWLIIKTKYNIQGSYETYKRFMRNNPDSQKYKQITRIDRTTIRP